MQETQVNPSARRAWQPIPVFLLGKSHGQRSLAGYSPCSLKELDTTEATEHKHPRYIYIYRYKVSIPGSKVCIIALKFVILDCYYLYYDIDILDLQNLLTGFKFVPLNISPDLRFLVTTILLCMSLPFLDSLHK